MKKSLSLILLLFSSQVFSETYVCSHIDSSGEIQIKKFERSEKDFWFIGENGGGTRYETSEDDRMVVLTNTDSYWEQPGSFYVSVFFIDKETKEWGGYLSKLSLILDSVDTSERGKCDVVD